MVMCIMSTSMHTVTLNIYATPASSIQFTKHTMAWQQEDLGPAFRIIDLIIDEQQYLLLSTDVVWLNE